MTTCACVSHGLELMTTSSAMQPADVLNCAFTAWYESFKHITEKSIIIPLPQNILDYLHEDGVVLPQSSQHGVYTKASNLAMDGDEDDADIRDDELMNMYEADWSIPNTDSDESQHPEIEDFDTRVKESISSLGGKVFPKLNWSAPKDAAWISFDRTLMCACPSDVYLLLKSSEFVAHDLDQPFSCCEESEKPSVSYCLVLRKWNPPPPAGEFRCFVRDRKLIGICQRNVEKFYSSIVQEKVEVIEDITNFFASHIRDQFSNQSYVFDVVRMRKDEVQLIDFNPWGIVTDGLLYDWQELQDESKWRDAPNVPDLRCVTSEAGVRSSSYSQYAVPLEVVCLPQGHNPASMMEMMNKLEHQSLGDDDSTSEEDAVLEHGDS